MTTNTKPLITIHDTQTDVIIQREMTDAEFEQYQIDQEYEIVRWQQINSKNGGN